MSYTLLVTNSSMSVIQVRLDTYSIVPFMSFVVVEPRHILIFFIMIMELPRNRRLVGRIYFKIKWRSWNL